MISAGKTMANKTKLQTVFGLFDMNDEYFRGFCSSRQVDDIDKKKLELEPDIFIDIVEYELNIWS